MRNKKTSTSAWAIIRPYWVSEKKWRAWGLLLLLIAINFTLVYINVRLNQWNVGFYDALTQRNLGAFKSSLFEFTGLAFIWIALAVFRIYYRQMLQINWREWMTHRYMKRWLSGRAYYRIERDRLADNPDQRLAEDLDGITDKTLLLFIDLLSTAVNLFVFIGILWKLSGPLSWTWGTMHFTVPGYMVWAALLYAILGSVITHWLGHRLTDISYKQQKVEADFRVMLVKLRENAEQIAFYKGEASENARLKSAFQRIRDNWWLIMRYTKRLTLSNSVYGQLALIFPIFVAAPHYFAGAFALGVLMQISGAFGNVSSGLSWFISSYGTLVSWKATLNRLREFDQCTQADTSKVDSNIVLLSDEKENGISSQGLQLRLPDQSLLTEIGPFQLLPGERWLIRGPSGSGKTTFMRALAGLWPFGEGQMTWPSQLRSLFLPQKSYLPEGSLKAALCYPEVDSAFSDEHCQEVLELCELAQYKDSLHEVARWTHRLSPGEQQRLAIGRALLHRPDFLFLDEATSALDTDTEQILYEVLIKHLPHTALISVGHRPTLEKFHTHFMDIHKKR